MRPFAYVSAPDVATALHAIATEPDAMFIGGGTNLVDLMREGVEAPGTIVDLTRLPLKGIEELPGGGVRIGALVTAMELPELPVAATSRYRKVRDRASNAFALVSVAAALDVEDGTVTAVRLALGGVAARPWRAHEAERILRGAPATEETFREAAEAELAPATSRPQNAFKIELARRTLVDTLWRLRVEGSAA